MNLEAITNKLINYFGKNSIPSPNNFPQSYLYYVELYKYLKVKSNENKEQL
tara:strand:+ start:889 stop:1041 length:153 start_codon:yes stop_codon:yes gene_type:complete